MSNTARNEPSSMQVMSVFNEEGESRTDSESIPITNRKDPDEIGAELGRKSFKDAVEKAEEQMESEQSNS